MGQGDGLNRMVSITFKPWHYISFVIMPKTWAPHDFNTTLVHDHDHDHDHPHLTCTYTLLTTHHENHSHTTTACLRNRPNTGMLPGPDGVDVDYWPTAQKFFREHGLIAKLRHFNKSTIDPGAIVIIQRDLMSGGQHLAIVLT